jgi:antitoxin CptB
MQTTPTTLEVRRKRAAYRAAHRGTKEMDWMLGRYGAARLDVMAEHELSAFEQLLSLPDPDLQRWLLSAETSYDGEFKALIDEIRAFHDVTGTKA